MEDSLDSMDSIELSDESIALDSSDEDDSVDSSEEMMEDSFSLDSSPETIEVGIDSLEVETGGSELETTLLTLEALGSLKEEEASDPDAPPIG